MTTRLAIDRLRSARHRREDYVGPWLPEPVLTDDDPAKLAELDETVTLGFLAVLERLNPVERAVFVLHEAFGVPYDEIASIVEKDPTNCRQIGRRARQRLREARPRFDVDPRQPERLTRAFVEAAMTGSLDGLSRLLHPEVELTSDGGADTRAARRPVVGRERVSRFLHNLAGRRPPGTEIAYADVNGRPGLILAVGGVPVIVQQLTWSDGLLREIHAVSNPAKLGAVATSLERTPRRTQRFHDS